MIYLIGEPSWDDYAHEFDHTADPEYGYYTSREEAEAFLEKANAETIRKRDEAHARWAEQVAAWKRKDDEARKLGFKNGDHYPSRPFPVGILAIIEVQEAKS